MARIGFLACAETLPGPGARRGDAFEHDLAIAALRPAFAAHGMDLVELDWRAPLAAFAGIDLVLLGTAWDYQDHRDAFVARLDALAMLGIAVHNPPATVRWNSDKGYLADLAAAGIPVIPTLCHDDPDRADLEDAMALFGAERVVVKRRIGAGGIGQAIHARGDLPPADWRFGHPALIQPFLASIQSDGEFTFVLVDGKFSHGVRKRPAMGDYRVQSLYGGREEAWSPDAARLALAERVLAALPITAPLYARIDMVGLEDGTLGVIEAELIEPYLYPEQGPDLGPLLARAVTRRLNRAPGSAAAGQGELAEPVAQDRAGA